MANKQALADHLLTTPGSMTTPTPVEVTQADRDAASHWVIVPDNARKIRDGAMDWNPTVQAFARHRTEALASAADLDEANRACLAKRLPEEPVFILLGRDPDAGNIVRLWAERRRDAGDPEHAGPVFAIADAMDVWAATHSPETAPPKPAYLALASQRALVEADLDWLAVAKAAGEHGIRYRTNKALVQFLNTLAALSLTKAQESGV